MDRGEFVNMNQMATGDGHGAVGTNAAFASLKPLAHARGSELGAAAVVLTFSTGC